MNLLPIPAFSDNYIWLLHDAGQALVVDPGDAAPVLATLHRLGLQLQGILVTHHHADHVGGVAQLHQATGAQVWGPAYEQLPEPVQRVQGGDAVQALGGPWQVIDVPGHTSGHIAFYSTAAQAQPVLFCGDTLFTAGCGRIFEGTPEQMHGSLKKLMALPDDTKVYCGHEYTENNLRFAMTIEPKNYKLVSRFERVHELRARGQPTVPATMEEEKHTNPFLRWDSKEIQANLKAGAPDLKSDPVAIFARIRKLKDAF